MRLLVIGGAGMLGHKLWQTADREIDTWATVRRITPALRAAGLGVPERTIEGVDVRQPAAVEAALDDARPTVVVNCVGIVKQLAAASDPVESITINALYPHLLARACQVRGVRLIHVSTDCVFDGARGGYGEEDTPNATDLYGRTKALGEVTGRGCLTVRTSIIGRELAGTSGLVEWFLSRRGGAVDGYAGAVFSGLTTLALSRVLIDIAARHERPEGLYHMAADPIDKDTLLRLMNAAFGAGVTITRRDEPCIDRSLDGSRFRAAARFVPEPWTVMVQAMAADTTPYDEIRKAEGDRQ